MGPLLSIHGDIPIERGNPKQAMAKVSELGKLWLSRGATVAIFPEGTRSKDGEIHRFKSGAFTLAKEAGVPILPVVFHGSDTLFRNGWRLPWRHTFRVDVLDPIPAEVVASMELRELSDMVREQMVAAKEVQKNMND
jgi:1-acyl-sn-glycerol-3-phosphate acyltransferase